MTSMLSLVIVLGSMIFAINYSNYHSAYSYADNFISSLERNDGVNIDIRPDNRDMNIIENDFRNIRYVAVIVDDDNNIIDFSEANFYSQSSISEMVEKISDDSGIIDIFRYEKISTSQGEMLVFVDIGRELEQFHSFLRISLFFSLFGVMAVFILVLLLSRNIMKPIKESYQKQKEFITNASHELKTPLTIISANNELLEMDYGENDSTNEIDKQVKKLTGLTNDLVSLSRMDEVNKDQLVMIEFPISDVVSEIAESFVPLAEANGLSLETDIQKNISYHGDEKSLRQLISILLDNAIKYANSDLPIRLTMKNDKKLIITVFNSCDNIEAGKQNALFERFYQANQSRNSAVSNGFGIGLSLASAIVHNHNGSIEGYSADGKSLMIEVRI